MIIFSITHWKARQSAWHSTSPCSISTSTSWASYDAYDSRLQRKRRNEADLERPLDKTKLVFFLAASFPPPLLASSLQCFTGTSKVHGNMAVKIISSEVEDRQHCCLTPTVGQPSRLASTSVRGASFMPIVVAIKTTMALICTQKVHRRHQQRRFENKATNTSPPDFIFPDQLAPEMLSAVKLTKNCRLPPGIRYNDSDASYQHWQSARHTAFVRKNHHAKHFLHGFSIKALRDMDWIMGAWKTLLNLCTLRHNTSEQAWRLVTEVP